MSALSKRVSKIEGENKSEELIVLLHSWADDGEYYGIRSAHGFVGRNDGEAEREFIDRAKAELMAIAKKSGHNSPCLVCWALKQTEIEPTGDEGKGY